MAISAWPFYSVAVTDTQFNRWSTLLSIARGRAGVKTSSDFAVSPGSGLQVSIAAGEAFVSSRVAYDTASNTVTLATANPTNPRIDLIVIRVNVSAKTVAIAALTGTPAASPVAPTPATDPAGITELPLAQVTVPAGATVLTAGNIADQRIILDTPLAIGDLSDVTSIGEALATAADAAAVRALLMSAVGQALATAASKVTGREALGLFKNPNPASPATDDLRYRDA